MVKLYICPRNFCLEGVSSLAKVGKFGIWNGSKLLQILDFENQHVQECPKIPSKFPTKPSKFEFNSTEISSSSLQFFHFETENLVPKFQSDLRKNEEFIIFTTANLSKLTLNALNVHRFKKFTVCKKHFLLEN
jgi:hypothetical protein